MASEAFRAIVDYLRADRELDASDRSIEEMRASMEAATSVLAPPPGVTIEAGTVGGVAGMWHRPDRAARADDTVVLYLHGGGYVTGSPATHRNLTARLALAVGASVFSADYRLGPEHPHPAASDDAVAAYKGLLDAGFAPDRIAIAGDSAGGGLTIATLVLLRDRGVPLPVAAVPISPWTDLSLSGDTMRTLADADPMVSEAGLRRMADWFLAGADARDPIASPLFADPQGLPPLFVMVGEVETLLDDSRRFAARAQDAGVDCRLDVYPEMIHVFPAFAGVTPEGDVGVDDMAEFLRKHLAL
ncbi:MAG TPA: alpha/beta hydrolase [Acidimicrobiia bacterium]